MMDQQKNAFALIRLTLEIKDIYIYKKNKNALVLRWSHRQDFVKGNSVQVGGDIFYARHP